MLLLVKLDPAAPPALRKSFTDAVNALGVPVEPYWRKSAIASMRKTLAAEARAENASLAWLPLNATTDMTKLRDVIENSPIAELSRYSTSRQSPAASALKRFRME